MNDTSTIRTAEGLSAVIEYTEAWNRHDAEGIVATFADGGTYADPMTRGPISGAALMKYTHGLWQAFPDLRFEFSGEVIASGDTVSLPWLMLGTNTGPFQGLPPSGKSVALPGVDLIRIAGNKLVSVVGYFDSRAVPEQLGLQVIVQPKSIGPFQFGTSTRVCSGSMATPGAFVVTSLEPRSDREIEEVRNLGRQVMMDMLRMEGFISATTVTCGDRQMTFTAWEQPEQVRQIYASNAHKQAMNKFYGPDLAAGAVFGVMRPERIANTKVRCAQCGGMVELKPDVHACTCGAAVEPRSFW